MSRGWIWFHQTWQPQVDAELAELRLEMDELKEQLEAAIKQMAVNKRMEKVRAAQQVKRENEIRP